MIAVLLGAVVQVGMLVGDHARLWHAAREAVRVAVVDASPQAVQTAAERSGLAPLEVTVEPGASSRIQGEPLTVSLGYRPRTRIPLLGVLFERVRLEARATMRIERP